jgi:hypothetical protein
MINQTGLFQLKLAGFFSATDRECQNFRLPEISGSEDDGVRVSDMDYMDLLNLLTIFLTILPNCTKG